MEAVLEDGLAEVGTELYPFRELEVVGGTCDAETDNIGMAARDAPGERAAVKCAGARLLRLDQNF